MTRRRCCGILTAVCWLAVAGAAVAGPYDVTFQVPLNLTKIALAVSKVRIVCVIDSLALPSLSITTPGGTAFGSVEFPVSGGQIITTATVVVPVTTLDTSN